MWSNGIKIAFFLKKLQKIAQRLGASPPDPLFDTFELLKYTIRVSQLRYFHFLTIILSPLPSAKSRLSAKHRPRLLIFHSTISLPHKKFLFRKFMMTSLLVICGLGPPNQKSWLSLWLRQ